MSIASPRVSGSPEKLSGPERRTERARERRDYQLERPQPSRERQPSGRLLPRSAAAPAAAPLSASQQRVQDIKGILSRDLSEIFFKLPPAKQEEIRSKGEEAAGKISVLLGQAKVQAGKIAALIRRWLAAIPGVNKFFLEQETKIKTDQVLSLKK